MLFCVSVVNREVSGRKASTWIKEEEIEDISGKLFDFSTVGEFSGGGGTGRFGRFGNWEGKTERML